MANETKLASGGVDDLIASIVAEAQFVAAERSVMRNLVKNFAIPQNNGGMVLQVPIYSTPAAAAVAEATDLSNTAVTTSKMDITLGEVGIMTTVTDLALNYSKQNVISDMGRLFGESIAKKIDTDLTGLFSGFSTYALGNATDTQTELTAAHLFAAQAKLRGAGVPGQLVGVFNPKSLYNLKKTMTSTFIPQGATGVVNDAMREGYIGRIAGIDIFETSNVEQDSATSCVNGVFARDALAIAIGSDLKIATQRDESIRGTEIVATAVYGVSELHDSYGVQVVTDNTVS